MMFEKIKENIKSGLTVSLVSIPLSVSLAVASGASPVVGIITAIWSGLVASVFGGSNYNIVGPTGALSGILATYAIANGAEALPLLAITSGILILIAWILKFERFLIYVPGSTIQGFTLGVAFIIALNQLNSAFSIKVPEVHEKFIDNVIESFAHFGTASWETFAIFAIFLVILLVLAKFLPKIPGAILLAPIGIFLGYLSSIGAIPIDLITLGDKFPNIAPALFEFNGFHFSSQILMASFTVAFVAILETMISAKIADGMTKTKYNKRKEIFGLSLANIVSGLAGGIPATAALARTSLNIKSGATHKVSATISSIAIIVISFIFLTWFRYIPMAVIASILVFVAIRMVEIEHLKHLFENDKINFGFAIIVGLVTVYEDPIVGILLGIALSLFLFVDTMSKGHFKIGVNDENHSLVKEVIGDETTTVGDDGHTIVYTIKGHLAYINGQSHLARFENGFKKARNIILRFKELVFIDVDGASVLDEIFEICKSRNLNVMITGISNQVEKILERSDDYRQIKQEGNVFEKTEQALAKLKSSRL